jgi:hypothetical protein
LQRLFGYLGQFAKNIMNWNVNAKGRFDGSQFRNANFAEARFGPAGFPGFSIQRRP